MKTSEVLNKAADLIEERGFYGFDGDDDLVRRARVGVGMNSRDALATKLAPIEIDADLLERVARSHGLAIERSAAEQRMYIVLDGTEFFAPSLDVA